MRYVRWIVYAFVLALLSTGAAASASALPSPAPAHMQAIASAVRARHVTSAQAQAHTAAWTVLVYMAADNDLESFGIADLNEMEFVGSTDNLNIVVQVDRSSQYDSSNGDWHGARRYFMTQDTDLDNVASQQVGDLGEINMGDPATLKDFIDWGVTTYPAQHYALVIWDHGGSWLGVGIDDSANGDALTLPELGDALKTSTEDTKINQFDLIGFDACLMGSIEVYRTIAPYARYGVASPELIPGQGWDYAGALGAIADDPTIDAPTFGHNIVDSFNTFYTQIITTYDYFSLGLVDLSATQGVVTALDSFTGSATSNDGTAGAAIARARSKSLVFGAFDDPQYADIWAATDMIGFMQQVHSLATDTNVVSASDAVASAGEKMILYHLSSPSLENSQGVSIYFPRSATFYTDRNHNQRYGQDTPSDLGAWQTFLGTFYSLFGGSRPEARITSATVDNDQQALFKLAFNGTGLSDALFYIALRLNGKPILVDYRRFDVGDFPAPGPAEPSVTWAKNIPVVTDGTTQIPALLIRDRRNPLRGVINGTYVPQNGDPQMTVQVLFDMTDPTQGKSISVWGIKDSQLGPMPSQIAVKPGDQFIPAWLSIGANGQLNGRQSNASLTFSTQPLLYFFVTAPEAVYDVGVQAIVPSGFVAAQTTTAQVDATGELTVNPPEPESETPPEENPAQEPTQPPATPPPAAAASSSSNESDEGPAGSIGAITGANQSAAVGQPFSEPFVVQVKDEGGNPVTGVTVTFSAPGSGPSGTFASGETYAPTTLDQMVALLSGSSSVSAQEGGSTTSSTETDETGTATSPDFTANTIAGNYVVTARTDDGLGVNFHLTNEPGKPYMISAYSGSDQSAQKDKAFANPLRAKVTDAYGNAVPGANVIFNASSEGPGAFFAGTPAAMANSQAVVALLTGASVANAQSSSAEAVTNNSGIATSPKMTANSIAGNFTAVAWVTDGQEVPPTYFPLKVLSGGADSVEFIWEGEGSPSAVITQHFSQDLQVYVSNTTDGPVNTGKVTFTIHPANGASATFDNSNSRSITVDIGDYGYAHSGPLHANGTTGSYTVTAKSGSVTSQPFDLENTGYPAPTLYNVVVEKVETQGDTTYATVNLEGYDFFPGHSSVHAFLNVSGEPPEVTVESSSFSSNTAGQVVIELVSDFPEYYTFEVINSTPGGGTSNQQGVQIDPGQQGYPQPTLNSIGNEGHVVYIYAQPASVDLYGSGFTSKSTVSVSTSETEAGDETALSLNDDYSIEQDTSTHMILTVDAPDPALYYHVIVSNPTTPPPGGGDSEEQVFTFAYPGFAPITSLSLASTPESTPEATQPSDNPTQEVTEAATEEIAPTDAAPSETTTVTPTDVPPVDTPTDAPPTYTPTTVPPTEPPTVTPMDVPPTVTPTEEPTAEPTVTDAPVEEAPTQDVSNASDKEKAPDNSPDSASDEDSSTTETP